MDAQQVLQHLQSLYPGQLVLYSSQVATVLGKSEKALSHLIARGQLPFAPKVVGSRKCVDIFQLAEWLANPSPDRKNEVDRKPPNSDKRNTRSHKQQPKSKREGLGARLMELRHETVTALRQLEATSAPELTRDFVRDLADELLRYDLLDRATVIVEARWLKTGNPSPLFFSEKRWPCESVDDAASIVHELQTKIATKSEISIVENGDVIFHSSRQGDAGDWTENWSQVRRNSRSS